MEPQTIVIDNFSGNLALLNNGPLTSGLARYKTSNGYNPFDDPMNLSFMETATSIKGSVITDCIVAAKERVESGVIYLYAVGHLGRVYKIQVNNPSAHNPNYNTPVLLTTLTSQSPTFTMGGSIEFYSGFIFIGSDMGVTKLAFDGSGEAFIGSTGSWTQAVPRPLKLFIGNLYAGNGNNVATITTGFIVTTYTTINPAFPTDYQVRDIDLSADGVYMVMSTTRNLLTSILSTSPDTTQIGTVDSVVAYWNGTDSGATSFLAFPTYNLSSYMTFSAFEYIFGNDQVSATLNTPQQKLLTLENQQYPLPNSISSVSNMVMWMAPEYNGTKLVASLQVYGLFDIQEQPGHYRLLAQNATLTGTADVMRVPCMIPVSNFSYGGANSGYTVNQIGSGKIYFSTIEYNGTTTSYDFYAFDLFPIGQGTSIGGVYETLQQLFNKKQTVKEVRIYLEPAVSGQVFQIDLIGIDGNVLTDSNGAKIFTGGGNLTAGETIAWYNPATQPSAAIGLRITNQGTVTPKIHKVELDVVFAGK